MRVDIPELSTSRLKLRGPTESDFDDFAAFYASPRSKHVGGPMTREVAWRQFASLWGHWLLRGYGRWMLERKDNGQVVGNVGLWYPEGWPEPEIGWTLYANGVNQGFATEAALASREYAYQTLGWTTLISLIAPDNTASAKLAQRLGARLEGPYEHERFGRTEIWRHLGPAQL